MKKWFPFLSVLLLLFCCNSAKMSPSAYLTIGDVTYSEEEVKLIFNSYPLNFKKRYMNTEGQIDYKSFREFMLTEIAFADKAKQGGLAQKAEVRAMLKWSGHRLLSQVYIRENIYGNLVSDQELKDLFQEYAQRFSSSEQYHVRHILITPSKNSVLYNTEKDDAQNEQQAVQKVEKIQKLLDGGADFAVLARKYSEDMTATEGGDLGFFKADDMEKSFVEPLKTMDKGDVQGPIKTSFGYHFVLLIDHKGVSTIPFESVKWDLMQQAIAKRRENVQHIVDQRIQDRIQQGEVRMP